MKHLIILSVLFFAGSAFATDYLIEDGDVFGVLSLYDYDTLLMTGGTGHDLGLGGWSTGTIEDTDPLNIAETEGGIWEMSVAAYSELTINGGEFYEIVGGQYSTINLHGGDIFGSLMVEHTTTWVNIFGYGFNNDPFPGSPLTGFWADDTPFSINLVDSAISTYDQLIFHEIPEPATLLLFGLGGLLLRKKR
ncbi:MAG: hypothetical protein DRP65_03905 [Planctomycetota bacterium]|nr:MAG: hypothetical protein DRP65_03905 [Planctomycetota bacterium]